MTKEKVIEMNEWCYSTRDAEAPVPVDKKETGRGEASLFMLFLATRILPCVVLSFAVYMVCVNVFGVSPFSTIFSVFVMAVLDCAVLVLMDRLPFLRN